MDGRKAIVATRFCIRHRGCSRKAETRAAWPNASFTRAGRQARPSPLKKIPSKKAFVKIPHRTLGSNKYRRLSLSSQCLYIALARLHNWLCHGNNGQRFKQRDWQLVLETGMDERAIRKARKELVNEGFIETAQPLKSKPTSYLVRFPIE